MQLPEHSFAVLKAVDPENDNPGLTYMYMAEDGTTIGCDGSLLLRVGGIPDVTPQKKPEHITHKRASEIHSDLTERGGCWNMLGEGVSECESEDYENAFPEKGSEVEHEVIISNIMLRKIADFVRQGYGDQPEAEIPRGIKLTFYRDLVQIGFSAGTNLLGQVVDGLFAPMKDNSSIPNTIEKESE